MAIITKFTTTEKPNQKAIFRNLPGWKFDDGVWVHPDETNQDFQLPQRSDLTLSNIPEEFYESGVASELDLEFDEINFEDERLMFGWIPAVRRGQYFSYNKSYNLHGTDSIIRLADDSLDDDSRSYIDLDQSPHPLLPITAEYLQRDETTSTVESAQRFTKVSIFKGTASNGIELDGDEPSNTDTSVYEFKVIQNDSEARTGVAIKESQMTEIETDIYQISSVVGPVSWYHVVFSRPDIFRTELAFDEFLARQTDPIANGPLAEGDYCIGYKNHWAEAMPMRVYLPNLHTDYGHVSYKPSNDTQILFNQDVQVAQSQTFDNDAADTLFYLTNFPVLDLTYYQDGDLAGPLQLDVSSFTLTVAGVPWTRVADLDSVSPADQAFELDPLYGTITFGDGGITTNGALPVGEIAVTYTQVPLVQYDVLNSRELFDDPREDLDPQVNAVKRGFLVLDNRRLTPYKIYLSGNGPTVTRADGSCCYGQLQVPAGSIDDLLTLRARVVARGLPEIGVPNIPVRFESPDGLVTFSQEYAVTDGDGYAYTEALGVGHFDEFVVADWMYEPLDSAVTDYLNPDPAAGDLVAEVPPWGSHITGGDTLTVGERFDGDVDDVYLLIQSIPADTPGNMLDYSGNPMDAEDYLEPYDGKRRKGGLTVVWSQTVSGAEEIVHPTSATPNAGNANWTDFQFPINIPTGQLIVSYKIVIDRSAEIVAYTVEEPILDSNVVNVCTSLNDEMKGQWKLPNLLSPDWDGFVVNPPVTENTDGSRISSGVYMSPNDFEVTELQPSGGGAPIVTANVGDGIDIIGTSFPTTEELYVSVYIIKVDGDDEIVAVKNISDDVTFVSATTIRIASLPTPPTEEYGIDYWIAVGGFHPEDPDTTDRKTAVPLEIGAAP